MKNDNKQEEFKTFGQELYKAAKQLDDALKLKKYKK